MVAGREIDDADPNKRFGHIRTVTTGVHPNGTADRTGNADGPFESGESSGGGSTSRNRQRNGPTNSNGGVLDFDGRQTIAEGDNDSIESFIGNEKV